MKRHVDGTTAHPVEADGALGSTRRGRHEPDGDMHAGHIVMGDPEGNEFCLERPRHLTPTERRNGPPTSPEICGPLPRRARGLSPAQSTRCLT